MNMYKVSKSLIVVVSAFLAGCGGGGSGGGGGGVSSSPDRSGGSEGGGSEAAAFLSKGEVSAVTGSVVGGEFVPRSVTVAGQDRFVVRAIADEDVFSDGTRFYRVASASDVEGFAAIGYTLNGDFIGTFHKAGSSPPTSGTASYAGPYRGQIVGESAGFANIVTGDAAIQVDFDSGSVNGSIQNRRQQFPTTEFNQAQLQEDVMFSGSVSGGVFETLHDDGNSAANIDGVISSGSMVGTVAITHGGASTLTASDVPEYGGFTAPRE